MNNIKLNEIDISIPPNPLKYPSQPKANEPVKSSEVLQISQTTELVSRSLQDSASKYDVRVSLKDRQATPLILPKSSKAAKTAINTIKIVWTIAWTIVRLAIGILFLVSRPKHQLIADPLYEYSLVKKARVEKKALAERMGKEFTTTDSDHPLFNPLLHDLAKVSRDDPIAQKEYSEVYNKEVANIFTQQGLKKNLKKFTGLHDKKIHIDPELVDLSRESYVNLILAYRFFGPATVGKEIILIHKDENGKEEPIKYTVDAYFEDSDGLVGYGLLPPPDSGAPPRLIFRGSNNKTLTLSDKSKLKLPTGYATDTASEIGKSAYDSSQGRTFTVSDIKSGIVVQDKTWFKKSELEDGKKESLVIKESITAWLTKAYTATEKRAFVSGHSLGGALAQRVAIDNPNLIGELFTLNSPRIEQSPLPKDSRPYEHIKVTHAIAHKDIFVPNVGGGRFSKGGLFSAGRGRKEVAYFYGAEGHTGKDLNRYCEQGKYVHYMKLSVEAQMVRSSFMKWLFDFVRPNITWRRT